MLSDKQQQVVKLIAIAATIYFAWKKLCVFRIGGQGSKMRDSQFPPSKLKKGIAVEMEHTQDPEIAKAIAKDHLLEDTNYYEKLAKMEATK